MYRKELQTLQTKDGHKKKQSWLIEEVSEREQVGTRLLGPDGLNYKEKLDGLRLLPRGQRSRRLKGDLVKKLFNHEGHR